jgi:hypothetical protein
MTKTFMKKVINEGTVDTENYRYRCFENDNGGYTIKRIAISMLDTTATCSDKSDTNPDGWEIVTVIK